MQRTATAVLSAASFLLALPTMAAAPVEQQDKIEWKKPIVYSLGLMGVGIAGLVATHEADDDPSYSNFKSAFENGPKRDDDGVVYNFILHPLWGSETYLRAREANMNILESIGFSFGASITWEYFIESWTQHPSSQDLLYTTGIGWMLGELRYRIKQRTTGRTHWWIDPIHKTLEHMGIVATSKGGKQTPTVAFTFRF